MGCLNQTILSQNSANVFGVEQFKMCDIRKEHTLPFFCTFAIIFPSNVFAHSQCHLGFQLQPLMSHNFRLMGATFEEIGDDRNSETEVRFKSLA